MMKLHRYRLDVVGLHQTRLLLLLLVLRVLVGLLVLVRVLLLVLADQVLLAVPGHAVVDLVLHTENLTQKEWIMECKVYRRNRRRKVWRKTE